MFPVTTACLVPGCGGSGMAANRPVPAGRAGHERAAAWSELLHHLLGHGLSRAYKQTGADRTGWYMCPGDTSIRPAFHLSGPTGQFLNGTHEFYWFWPEWPC